MTFTEHMVTSADGTNISYRKVGKGPGLVVVHGSLRAGSDYEELAHYLADDFTVCLPDRRGRGNSGPQGEGYSFAAECADIGAVLRDAKASLLFGHSFGGAVSLEVALSGYPLSGLALYEPALSVGGSLKNDSVPGIRAALADHDDVLAFSLIFKIISGIPGERLPMVVSAVTGSPFWPHLRSLLPTFPAEITAISATDNGYQKYKAIAVPTLLLHGDLSPQYAQKAVAVLAAIISSCETIELPGIGHNGPDQDAPNIVADSLKKFFGRLSGDLPSISKIRL